MGLRISERLQEGYHKLCLNFPLLAWLLVLVVCPVAVLAVVGMITALLALPLMLVI